MRAPILGWDVGGANVKAVRLCDSADTLEVVERPLALWREPHRLAPVLAEVARDLGGAQTMAVTMTAELADCFATKREGVAFVLDAFGAAFPGVDPRVYAVDGRFRSVREARARPLDIAAANWMAAAALVARSCPDAVLIDVGSTTSDVIPIVAGRVAASGRTDPERLASGELVYTGALRTPICAIVRLLPLGGRRCRVAAEQFAIAADVYRWLDRIEDGDYTCDTPDGRGRSRPEAGARLARMVGADLDMIGAGDITAMAECVTQAQVRQIAGGIRQVRRRLGSAFPRLAVVAGQGAFLAEAAARAAGLATRSLAAEIGSAARAAPAAAVALLLAESEERR